MQTKYLIFNRPSSQATVNSKEEAGYKENACKWEFMPRSLKDYVQHHFSLSKQIKTAQDQRKPKDITDCHIPLIFLTERKKTLQLFKEYKCN